MQGITEFKQQLSAIETYFYWPSMKKDIQAYVSQCLTCQKVKYDRGKQPGLLFSHFHTRCSLGEYFHGFYFWACQNLFMVIQVFGQ